MINTVLWVADEQASPPALVIDLFLDVRHINNLRPVSRKITKHVPDNLT